MLHQLLRLPVVTLLALVFLSVSGACTLPANQAPREGPFALVWEAWGQVRLSYPDFQDQELDHVVGNSIAGLPNVGQAPPYPFLTEVGRLRGQPPVGVPPELADLWRAMTLHQKKWPEYPLSDLAQEAIRGMVAGLPDSQALYVTPAEYPQARQSLQEGYPGTYQGIGADVKAEVGFLRLFPLAGSPAERAGLQPGDVLLAVDGAPVAGLEVAEVINQVRGPAGTSVRLTVQRIGQLAPLEYQVNRDTIPVSSVGYKMTPGDIGYLSIDQLRDNTGQQVTQALEELRQQPLAGLILDLRAVDGGSVDAALAVAGHFLPAGSLWMYEVDRTGQRTDRVVPPGAAGLGPEILPLAVVVDEETSGAAEALAAALQDAKRAEVLGATTAGEVATYSFVELRDGSALYLPTARWHTPSGRQVSRVGVRPDVEVLRQPEERGFGDSQLNRAYKFLDALRPVSR